MIAIAPIAYSVVESPRAKHLRLKVTLHRGLEVVVPRDYDRRRIPGLLDRKKTWIRAALERVEQNRKFIEPEPIWKPPTFIRLDAIGKVWHVEHVDDPGPWATVKAVGPDRLRLSGALDDRPACEAALQRWMMRQAHEHLVPWLREISARVRLSFRRSYVKRQRTRWASCSRAGAISVNARLLFLDRELVQYVFIHELCHTVHMNHSAKFWMLVRSKVPQFQKLDATLRVSWRCVPTWAGRSAAGMALK